jgi:hypothetical protein
MPARFVFHIRPISEDEGFEVDCEGVLRDPLKTDRLFEAVAKAAMLGKGLGAEIQILGLDGLPVEVLPLDPQPVLAD